MNLNTIFNSFYRITAVAFLTAVFLIATVYAFLVGFYGISNSWSAPLILSPTQAQVLSFQPQVASLEASLNKQRIELATAQSTSSALENQSSQVQQLLRRVDGAMGTEATQLQTTGKAIDAVLADKKIDIKATGQAITDAERLLSQVDSELASKLITADQAAQRRISLQAGLNAATDARAQAIQLQQQVQQAAQGASTLRGGSSSIAALNAVRQAIELRLLSAQLEIQYATATATVTALTQSIAELERVIQVAKTSPYYRALREEVTVAFVPYDNLAHAEVGANVYDCYLQVIACRKVGEVIGVYAAEVGARHPLFKTDLKGQLVEVKFTQPKAAKSQVVFIGGKPLFL